MRGWIGSPGFSMREKLFFRKKLHSSLIRKLRSVIVSAKDLIMKYGLVFVLLFSGTVLSQNICSGVRLKDKVDFDDVPKLKEDVCHIIANDYVIQINNR